MTNTISRVTSLAVGTRIGLQGDYNAPCGWDGILSANVLEYVQVQKPSRLDTGLLAVRPDEVLIYGAQGGAYVGKRFLLLHRYDDSAWDHNDPIVHVYGLSDEADLSILLRYEMWHQKAEWLSAAAIMCILDPDNLSQMGKVLLQRYTIL